MDITYLGSGSVRLSGKNIEVVTDPRPGTKVKADVVTWSAPAEVLGELVVPEGAKLLDSPGEYEIKGAHINAVGARLHVDEAGKRGTVFSFTIDGLNVVVLGNIAGKLPEDDLEPLGQADVLVVPVGGGGLTLDAVGAAEVVAQMEPNWVVPVHYDDGVSKYPVPQAKVDVFLKEMGCGPEPMVKLRVSGKDPVDETQVVVLTRS